MIQNHFFAQKQHLRKTTLYSDDAFSENTRSPEDFGSSGWRRRSSGSESGSESGSSSASDNGPALQSFMSKHLLKELEQKLDLPTTLPKFSTSSRRGSLMPQPLFVISSDAHANNTDATSTEAETEKNQSGTTGFQVVGPEFYEFEEKYRFWFQIEFKNSFAFKKDPEHKRFTHYSINAYLLDPSDITDENESFGEKVLKETVENINEMASTVNLQMLLGLYWRMNLLDNRLLEINDYKTTNEYKSMQNAHRNDRNDRRLNNSRYTKQPVIFGMGWDDRRCKKIWEEEFNFTGNSADMVRSVNQELKRIKIDGKTVGSGNGNFFGTTSNDNKFFVDYSINSNRHIFSCEEWISPFQDITKTWSRCEQIDAKRKFGKQQAIFYMKITVDVVKKAEGILPFGIFNNPAPLSKPVFESKSSKFKITAYGIKNNCVELIDAARVNLVTHLVTFIKQQELRFFSKTYLITDKGKDQMFKLAVRNDNVKDGKTETSVETEKSEKARKSKKSTNPEKLRKKSIKESIKIFIPKQAWQTCSSSLPDCIFNNSHIRTDKKPFVFSLKVKLPIGTQETEVLSFLNDIVLNEIAKRNFYCDTNIKHIENSLSNFSIFQNSRTSKSVKIHDSTPVFLHRHSKQVVADNSRNELLGVNNISLIAPVILNSNGKVNERITERSMDRQDNSSGSSLGYIKRDIDFTKISLKGLQKFHKVKLADYSEEKDFQGNEFGEGLSEDGCAQLLFFAWTNDDRDSYYHSEFKNIDIGSVGDTMREYLNHVKGGSEIRRI